MTLPHFLVIGGVRCGTTSLYQQMRRHPQVFMPSVKEPAYFIYQGESLPADSGVVTTPASYEALFEPAEDGQLAGEASAAYLYMARVTAERIRRQLPDVKVIAQLRHPVERAHSQFRMARMVRREQVDDFGEALRLEDRRVEAGEHVIFHYRRQSFYHDPLRRFLELFDEDRVHVTLFSDFARDPATVLRGIYEFLGVDPKFEARNPDRPSFSTRPPRSPALERMLHRPGRTGRALRRLLPESVKQPLRRSIATRNRAAPPAIDAELRARLVGVFHDDVLKVQDTIDRDLSEWLS